MAERHRVLSAERVIHIACAILARRHPGTRWSPVEHTRHEDDDRGGGSMTPETRTEVTRILDRAARRILEERLSNPNAFLSRTDLRELGLGRRAVDAVFRALNVVVLPGYSRPLVRVSDYRELIDNSTYDGTRVRPTRPS